MPTVSGLKFTVWNLQLLRLQSNISDRFSPLMVCRIKSSPTMVHSLFQLLFRSFVKLEAFSTPRLHPTVPDQMVRAERLVQTFKNAINKIDPHTKSEIQEALVDFLAKYRSTPHSATNQTPLEMLNNRRMRTILDLLHPCNSEAAKSQQCQKADYDDHTQPNKFKVGDLVWARNFREGKRWLPGNIIQQNGNVLYEVFIKELNSTWHQHANQLRTRIEQIPESESVGDQVQETPQETVQPSTPPLHRSTRVRRPRQPWSPRNT